MGNVQPVTAKPTRFARLAEKIEETFRAPKQHAEFRRSIVDLDGYESFEDCSLSEGKKKPEPTRTPSLNGRVSPIPSDKVAEFKLRLKSELAKQNLDGYYDLSFKDVDGFLQVNFRRRVKGGGVRIGKELLQKVIRRAERLVMLPAIAEFGSDRRSRIAVKRTTKGENEYIVVVNVPENSPIGIVVGKLVLHFVSLMFEGVCQAFGGSTDKKADNKLHAFRIAPSGDKRPQFAEIDRVDFEDLVVRTAAEKISRLEEDGIDIHHCDVEDLIEKVLPAVRLDLSKTLSIDFT